MLNRNGRRTPATQTESQRPGAQPYLVSAGEGSNDARAAVSGYVALCQTKFSIQMGSPPATTVPSWPPFLASDTKQPISRLSFSGLSDSAVRCGALSLEASSKRQRACLLAC